MGRFRNVDRRVPSSITLGSGEVEGFAFADTKGDSTESHVHVAVDEHPIDDPSQFHRKFRSMVSEEFDAIVNKTHRLSVPLR
jgi:hypothetical protein